MIFDSINLLLLIVVVADFFLAAIIYYRGRHKVINVLYTFVILAVIAWTISMFFFRASSSLAASIIWVRILYFSATFTAFGFLLFAHVFPFRKPALTLSRILVISLPQIVVATLSLIPGAIIRGVELVNEGEKIINWGGFYWMYVVYIPLYFLLGYFILFEKYQKQVSGIAKTQIRYVLLGFFVSANLAMITNLVFPMKRSLHLTPAFVTSDSRFSTVGASSRAACAHCGSCQRAGDSPKQVTSSEDGSRRTSRLSSSWSRRTVIRSPGSMHSTV
jgi:hypothetical protein